MKRIYRVKYKPLRGAWGEATGGQIYIDPRCRGKKHMEILIHEALHVLFPKMEEDEVIEISVELTRVMWREGYRRADLDETQRMQNEAH